MQSAFEIKKARRRPRTYAPETEAQQKKAGREMFCTNCGKQTEEGSVFCPFCGERLEAAPADNGAEPVRQAGPSMDIVSAEPQAGYAPAAQQPVQPEMAYAPETQTDRPAEWGQAAMQPPAQQPPAQQAAKKKRSVLPWLIPLIVVLVLGAAAAVIVPITMHNAKQTKYNTGVELLDNGEYSAALPIFEELGDFDDSADMAKYARLCIKYKRIEELVESEKYYDAMPLLDELGEFKDSKELYDRCLVMKDYDKAKAMFTNGDYSGAIELFSGIADYKDSLEYIRRGNERLDYAKGVELFEAGDFEAAAEMLQGLDEADFPDVPGILYDCEYMPKYLAAVKLLGEGRRYDAYKALREIKDYKDAYDLSLTCFVDMPATGESYRNSAYGGRGCSLTIKPPSDGSATYFKVYDQSGETLISVVFINSGDQAIIYLPAGSYIFKAAYGYGNWFGEDDMFGDEGVYQRLKSSATSSIFQLERGYDYTLTLRSASTTDGNVTMADEDADTF